MKSQRSRRQPASCHRLEWDVEALETRRLLAGVVSISTHSAGDIIVSGDKEANDIRIVFDRVGTQSILVLDGHGTAQIERDGHLASQKVIRIHTTDSGRFEIQRDLRIRMHGGDDEVDVLAWTASHGGVVIARDRNVDLGDGSDFFFMEGAPLPNVGEFPTLAARDVRLSGGTGSAGESTFFGQRLHIRTGSGSDTIRITNEEPTQVIGRLELNRGSGDDLVRIESKSVFHAIASIGTGDDLLEFDFDPAEDFINFLAPCGHKLR